ncbi:hypothetical protein [Mycoplasmoides alvi]|uniref:hypothetical protein n=1 Tax=Mycoplasmoides alvi TaxID=78580 RepID=UPI00051B056B|nr:hypothetical protein [Mycoplasmoides alvi]
MKKLTLILSTFLPIVTLPACLVACAEASTNSDNNSNVSNSYHVDTTIKDIANSSELKINNINLSSLTTLAAYDEIINYGINEFVLKNLNYFFDGDVSLITDKSDLDCKISTSQANETEIELTINVLANRWFKNKKIQTQPLSQIVKINNLQPLPTNLDSSGGEIKDPQNPSNPPLKVSAYNSVIKLFKINSSTPLTSLTNDWFNNILSKLVDFQNLKVSISEGSTSNGTLVLNLSGMYKQQKINQSITISGFITNDFKNVSSVSLKQIKINQNQWFTDLKPIISSSDLSSEITKITSDEWLTKYLADFILYDEMNQRFISTKNDLVKNKIVINNLHATFSETSNKKIVFNFECSYQSGNYNSETNSWVFEESHKWNSSALGSLGDVPTSDDAKVFLINETRIDQNQLKTHYPSYYLGLANWAKHVNGNYPDNSLVQNTKLTSIHDKYFKDKPEKFAILIDKNSVIADDFKNNLSFNVQLYCGDVYDNFSKNFTFENQNKNFNELPYLKSLKNQITLNTTDDSSTSIHKRIYRVLKNNKNLINNLGLTQSTTITVAKDSLIPNEILNGIIFFTNSNDDITNVQNKFNSIKKSFTPKVFDFDLDLSNKNTPGFEKNYLLNLYSGLYWLDENNAFILNSIVYKFTDQIDLKITNMDGTKFSVEFIGTTSIGLDNNYQTIDLTTTFLDLVLKNSLT